MIGLKLFTITLILTLVEINAEVYDVDAVCTLVQDGTKLASLESCQTFYVCNRGRAQKQSCETNQSFEKNSQACQPIDQVQCYWGSKTPCVGQPGKIFVPVAGSCRGWIYCESGKEVGRGACSPGLIFINGECKYGTCNEDGPGVAGASNFQSICQIMPNFKYFGSTTDCKQWQVCRNDELHGGSCQNNMVYDPPSNLCKYETIGTCNYVTGKKVQPDEEKGGPCSSFEEGSKRASDANCGSYFECVKQQWIRRVCTDNRYWDIEENICRSRVAAVTSSTCDRCQYARTKFVNAPDDSECRKYLVCKDGSRKGAGSYCPKDHYFDEIAQACINDDFTAYAAKNGACKDRSAINECLGKCSSNQKVCGLKDGVCEACVANGTCNEKYCTTNHKCTDPSKCFVEAAVCNDCEKGVDNSGAKPACKI